MNKPVIALTASALKDLPSSVNVPTYDRRPRKNLIVHIGVGGFHRAHQASYLDDLLGMPDAGDWSLCGVALLPRDEKIFRAMRQQDCLYTVVRRTRDLDTAQVIGSIMEILYAPENPEAVIEKMASPECRIVSLTITEGGYYFNQGTGRFDDKHPDIVHDLAEPAHPVCVFGYLAEALERRKQRGIKPFTLQSCDNIQSNGDVLKAMFLEFCRRRAPALAQWLAEKGAFPNSMVDGIVPATTDALKDLVRERWGIDDAWPVVTETWRQWVIEDRFCDGRPEWEKVGAQMTHGVLPYEKMKLRLLNAAHQALGYIGILCGHTFVHETMEDERIRKLVRAMMDLDVTPILSPVPGMDLDAYKDSLIERFGNPAIGDQLARIVQEGSARIPKFVLPSIVDQLSQGGSISRLSFTVASWFRYLTGLDDSGAPLPMSEPLIDTLGELARKGGPDPRSLLSLHSLFGDVLPNSPVFVDEVEGHLRTFYEKGAEAALARVLER
ncbi:MAG: mannitol dehydrogenase family protein [Rectinemataceae bacterium]|jgi:mannitol 2-dehydrogenase